MFRLAKENARRNSLVKVSDIKILHKNTTNLQQRLLNLLTKFEISKGQLSSNERLFLHQQFLNLANWYRTHHMSNRAVLLAEELANHAYKSPEGQ